MQTLNAVRLGGVGGVGCQVNKKNSSEKLGSDVRRACRALDRCLSEVYQVWLTVPNAVSFHSVVL